MTEANFNKRQCIRALRKLGFYENSKRGRLHDKWFPPLDLSRNIHPGQPHFIIKEISSELCSGVSHPDRRRVHPRRSGGIC